MLNRLILALFCVLPTAFVFAADDPPKPHVRLKFDGNTKDEGTGKATVTLKNTTYKDKALVLNGIYPFGEKDPEKASDVQVTTPKLSYDTFTVAVSDTASTASTVWPSRTKSCPCTITRAPSGTPATHI